jgi:hypothetical protein
MQKTGAAGFWEAQGYPRGCRPVDEPAGRRLDCSGVRAMSLFAELKRRKVVRVAIVYAATAFAVLQAADIMLPQMGVPPWGLSLVVALVVLVSNRAGAGLGAGSDARRDQAHRGGTGRDE